MGEENKGLNRCRNKLQRALPPCPQFLFIISCSAPLYILFALFLVIFRNGQLLGPILMGGKTLEIYFITHHPKRILEPHITSIDAAL